MSYLSIEFALIFFVFFVAYWSLIRFPRAQNILLLIASYGIIYSLSSYALAVLLGYTLIVYLLARGLAKRRISLGPYLIYGLVILSFFIFKYYEASTQWLQESLTRLSIFFYFPILNFILPLGLSFYVFHSVSYLFDVNNQKIRPVSLFHLALYLAFFPSVISGPINRAKDLLPQMIRDEPRTLTEGKKALGLIGLAIVKLLLISTYLSENYVNATFNSPINASAEDTLLAVYAYAFQIYFNFSGYSDLVIGIGLLLGFNLPLNFNLPYLAQNLRDFWQRWHISLSTFIRDFIYIPLGGSYHGLIKTQIYLMIAMLLSGIWHGVGMNFIIWGTIHGLGLVWLNLKPTYLRLHHTNCNRLSSALSGELSRLVCFHFICFAWIFFRATDLEIVQQIFANLGQLTWQTLIAPRDKNVFIVLGIVLFYVPLTKVTVYMYKQMQKLPWPLFIIVLTVLIQLAIMLSPPGIPDFIYASF